MVFQLTLANGRDCLFHLEFQGRRSQPAMPMRQLNHLSRLALLGERPSALESFVLYVEKYAGNQDNGVHLIARLDGSPAISWYYTPVHLWRQPAEPLLALDKPGIIPLMGLMDIQIPEVTIPHMVEQIQHEPEESKREFLFSTLLALMDNKEYLIMIENLLETDDLYLDTPYLRRLRKQTKLEDILEAVAVRLNPPVQVYRSIEQQLPQVSEFEDVQRLFVIALTAASIDDFLVSLNAILEAQAPT